MKIKKTNGQKFDSSPPAANDKFLIDSRIEILYILRATMRRNAPVTLYFDHGNHFVLTSILAIAPERGEIVMDYGADEELNQLALHAEKLAFVTYHDQVKVQFVCQDIKKARFEDRGAFSIRIPESLLRMQRREYYRITTPAINPPKCAIPLPEGYAPGTVEVPLVDISCGGIAVIDPHAKFDPEPGTLYVNCRIALPETGALGVTIRMKNTFEVTLKNGLVCKRSGCEFVAMPENKLTVIQRYILKLEREKNARETSQTCMFMMS